MAIYPTKIREKGTKNNLILLPLQHQMKKTLLIIFGSFSFVLGIIGIFLPIIPTTPFLLLSAGLFAKSSEKLYNWLMNHKIFGDYIRNFREDKAIPLKGKVIAISTMWIFMLYSIFFIVNEKWYLQVLLGSIALAVTIHILSYRTKKKSPKLNSEDPQQPD